MRCRREQHAHRSAERGVEPAEGVRRNSREQRARRLVGEASRQPGRRLCGAQPEPAQGDRMARHVHDRLEDLPSQVVEVAHRGIEHSVPAPSVNAQRGVGEGSIPGGEAGTPVIERVCEVDLGPRPPQTVALQAERAEVGRSDAGRMECCTVVMQYARKRQLAGPGPTAELGLRLEHEHLHAGRGQPDGGGQPVGTAPHHDCARHETASLPVVKVACRRNPSAVQFTCNGIGPLGNHGCSRTQSRTSQLPRSTTPALPSVDLTSTRRMVRRTLRGLRPPRAGGAGFRRLIHVGCRGHRQGWARE